MGKIDFADLSSAEPRIKYGCAKNLLTVARENPAEIYPELDFFVKLLDSENSILKWTAIDIIGHLARVDKARKIDKLMARLFELLDDGKLITASHAIDALADVALAKPEHQKKITRELLKVEHYGYDTDECRNIAMGKVVQAISSYFPQLGEQEATIEFVQRQTRNSRSATRKKAELFLKKHRKKNIDFTA